MRSNKLKSLLTTSGLAASVLLLASAAAFGQQQVNLTAGPANATLPDGTMVPMWGYSCGTAVALSTATCAKLNPNAAGWSPIVITVPTTATGGLAINLTNNLSFTPTGSTTANTVPTSIVIVGQLGGGLGDASQRTTTLPPDHTNAQPVTWPIAGTAPGTVPPVGVGTPPAQGRRVQSFSTEVAAGATTALTWSTLRPGTYLIESGTHPSIQGPMGLYGILVVTTAPTVAPATPAAGIAYPGVTYSADLPLLLSEIDPVQNNAVNAAVNTSGFAETAVWSGLPGGCGNPASSTYHTCYPPAVNYTPLYYLFNGVAFDKTNASASLFPTSPATGLTPLTGNVLVRFVNAGLRMHVPSIVGSQTGTATAPALPPSGFSLIAEDGNPLPGVARVQSEVFLAPGKTTDVMVNVPTAVAPATVPAALPVFDRELSLSGNATSRDAGMLAYISVNGAGLPSAAAPGGINTVVARADTYNSLVPCAATPCPAFTVSDPGKGLIANDSNVYGVTVLTAPTHGTLTLNADGTFSYVPSGTGTNPDSFTYAANGNPLINATVALGAAPLELAGGITMGNISYTSTVATSLSIKSPGILSVDKDAAGYPLSVAASTVVPSAGLTLSVDPTGGFNASVTAPGTYTFTYSAQNSQGTQSAASATVTLIFPAGSGLQVHVYDGTDKTTPITDYRWIIEEDRTFYVDPNKTSNGCTAVPPATTCTNPTTSPLPIVPTFGANFHTSYMPVVAAGCTGPLSCESGQTLLGVGAVCDVGNGVCRTTASQETAVLPRAVHLDPNKRYYISILPGDAANPFIDVNLTANCVNGSANANQVNPSTGAPLRCGHGMGGAPVPAPCPPGTAACTASLAPVTIWTQPAPFPPAKLSVFVFEDDFPLNGEQDAGGGIDVLATNEPGLGHFNITLFDDAGGTGDATGQMTYDMFNQPLANSLAGTIDPATGNDACPISSNSRQGPSSDLAQTGITGTIVTCPRFEALPNGGAVTNVLSPFAGQAVIANLMPGRYGVVATPGADLIAAGEEWLQTNTLDGQKAHDSFLRIGEPSFFQEFGPAGYHVSIGFANPKIINSRLAGVCSGTDLNVTGTNCHNSISGVVTTERMSRSPDERLYSSGSNDSFAFTQCYVSFGDTDGEDFAFTKCNPDGSFSLSGLPDGTWRVTVFDQWNDMLVDGLSTPVALSGGSTTDMGQIAMNQWQANIYTRTFFDPKGTGVPAKDTTGVACTAPGVPANCNANFGNDISVGLTLAPTNIRFRDGSYSNFNNTDLAGNAGFNEEFPLFSWYVIESDATRYKNTGTHVVYDSGGPADGTTGGGTSNIGHFLANTIEQISVPTELRVPGAVYCANADCAGYSVANGPSSSATSNCTTGSPATCGTTPTLSTGRIDPPWVSSEAWQGFSGQNSFLEFGKKPFAVGENGGIRGEVIYASTRPFDDPQLLIHTSWTPDVPGVTINLYQVGTAPDGSQSLTLVDTTKTSSWDDWAQGFRSDGNPNMNCPGQGQATAGPTQDLFFFTLYNQPMYLDVYNNGGTVTHPVPDNSQFKCYDGMHNWNQLQPAPYDGAYTFPSVTAMNAVTGAPTATNCHMSTTAEPWGCVTNPDATDSYRFGTPMLPHGQFVVEVVVPPGYELVKEEDKNILIGDNYIAPVTVQFPGLGSAIYILPDQAQVSAAFNANNAQNPTNGLGRYLNLSSHEGDTGSVETFWPCVGASRTVPDYISLFPQSHEVAPFAGAKRNLCDRKLVTLDDQTSALAKFWIFSSTHVAAHFTGVITDDFTSEFDPFSPQFGEKFSPPNMPISLKDWTGTEISRVYSDQWGTYNGLTYSTWEVNPPNPTGYAPTMMVTCMNDPGTGPTPDPLFNPEYSQFCYEIPFMPGQTQYMDTPVIPVSAFAGAGYNNPDCAYPDATPAISSVNGTGVGPWVSGGGNGPVTALNLVTDGSRYMSRPSINFSTATGSGAAATVNDLKVLSIAPLPVIGGGSGYTSAPTVTVSVPGGAGGVRATATATVSGGRVTSIAVTNPGSGYTGLAIVTISPPPSGTQAVATASMEVNTVTLTAGGSYSAAPNVTFTGGGLLAAQATATATITASGGSTTLTITALGNQVVPNNAYSGPAATTAPFNAKTITRHYGFGATKGSVTIGGVAVPAANITTWNDTTIVLNVPGNLPASSLQQQAQYGGSPTQGGQLVITRGDNGKQSIDAITVTVGGKAPTHVNANGTGGALTTIQAAIDAALPGDLIIVDPGVYNELLLMWKPVRLQGVGAASSVINANSQPAGKLTPWRARVECLFGLALNGQPLNDTGTDLVFPGAEGPGSVRPPPIKANVFDTTGAFSCPGKGWNAYQGGTNNPQVDRIPLEGTVGWDTTLNGNLAELLQEPSLMGAYEGAGITVLAKGVRYPGAGTSTTNTQLDPINPATRRPYPLTNVFGTGQDTDVNSYIAHEGEMPVPTVTLTGSATDCGTGTVGANGYVANPFPSNFQCNPSRIDGLSVTNSSQGGGGIFVHGWGHNLEIANNRVYNNTGTMTGGIVIGQGESPDSLLSGNSGDPIGYNGGLLEGFDQQPWTCNALVPGATSAGNVENVSPNGTYTNEQLPYCYNINVYVHNNAVTRNSSIGDELFSSTPAGAGGVSFCTGSDNYKFNYNWICGNLSTGDGGGVAHVGFSWNGDIEHNQILFNQSTNPTVPTNGGGIIVMGAAPDGTPIGAAPGTECGSVTDVDCAPGLSDGTGPGLKINANLIMGNGADSGSGGGLRLQSVNGTEVGLFPNQPSRWYSVNVTNNIIANNVAGWDGAGVSLQDALAVNLINNTIVSNDTTASSGVLFNTIGAPEGSAPGATNQSTSTTTSAPQAAGVVTMRNSSLLSSSLPGNLNCPAGHGSGSTCRNFSVPLLYNDVIWENRSFYIGIGPLGTGTLNQQNTVALFTSFTNAQAPSQPSPDGTTPNGAGVIVTGGSGACTAASYWDIGVRGDTGPRNHNSGLTLAPVYSVLTDAGDYPGNHNLAANPTVVSQYCNGSRSPPEFMSSGYQVPPGIADAQVPNPIFNLTPAATVDEGNNWINMSWGPLAETGPVTGTLLGNYALAGGSPAINYIPLNGGGENGVLGQLNTAIPTTDFFGNTRPSGSGIDVGAVEFQGASTSLATLTPDALNFGDVAISTTSTAQTLTLSNPGAVALTGITVAFQPTTPPTTTPVAFSRPAGAAGGTCTATLAGGGATCTITVVFNAPAATGTVEGTLTVTGSAAIAGSTVSLSGNSVSSPTLTSIAPVTGMRGTVVAVTLTGANFSNLGSTVAVSGSGVTVSNVTVEGSTMITATFTIANNAQATARTVSVTTGGLTTNTVVFTVTAPPPPTLTTILPNAHARGGLAFSVTLTGTNFLAGATVGVTGNGFNVSGVTVVNDTTITANFRISNFATRNVRNVTVNTLGGTSGSVPFTVN